ncbi:MAG: AEC family transporter [Candidatus Dadabacteria bacterium]|nr:MAG: AEC family transporter [Candidatus Dadabacteria bacterium]
MSLLAVLATVAPVFALIALGAGFSAWRRVDIATLTDVVVYLGGPALVFRALVEADVGARETAQLVAGTITVVIGSGGLAVLATRALGVRLGAMLLPAMFMNAGNMLLPLSLFAFGQAGLERAAIILVVVVALHSTIGVAIATGTWTWMEIFRLPYFYALLGALAVRVLRADLPAVLARPVNLLGDMAIPLMLIALGSRLRLVRGGSWRRPLFITGVRLFGGFLLGLSFAELAGLAGTARGCLVLASAMPAAVVNFVFAERYENEAAEVAMAVVASTCASVVTTPLVLWVAS